MRHRRHPVSPALGAAIGALLVMLSACGGYETNEKKEVSPAERFQSLSYPVSGIFFAHEKHPPGEGVLLALDALDEVRGGADFAEVARRVSDDPLGQARGGFLGFRPPKEGDPMSGPVQAMTPGAVGGPISTKKGFHVLYRHTFEEGRRMEAEYIVPIYGVFFPYAEEPSEEKMGRAEAEQRARSAWKAVNDGELTLLEAAQKYSPLPLERPTTYIGPSWPDGQFAKLRQFVMDIEPGELAPVAELPEMFLVLRRGQYYRSMVFHILIHHARSVNRDTAITRSRSEAEALAKEVLAKAAPDGSNWQRLVRDYSDEKISVSMDGWIGPLTNGGLIPDSFEQAVIDTEPGRIVDHVIETPDGFHVVWRAN